MIATSIIVSMYKNEPYIILPQEKFEIERIVEGVAHLIYDKKELTAEIRDMNGKYRINNEWEVS